MHLQSTPESQRHRSASSKQRKDLPTPSKNISQVSKQKPIESEEGSFRFGTSDNQEKQVQKEGKTQLRTRPSLNRASKSKPKGKKPTSTQNQNQNQRPQQENAAIPEKGVQRFRKLLPEHFQVKFSKNLQDLYKLVTSMNRYLYEELPKQKYPRDNFCNIQKYLQLKESLEIREIQLMEINYIFVGYFLFYRDPFKNLVVQVPKLFGRLQGLADRDSLFRRRLFDYYTIFGIDGAEDLPLPIRELQVKRIEQFFPPKKFRHLESIPQPQPDPALEDFISKIRAEVTRKELEQSEFRSSNTDPIPKHQIQELQEALHSIYQKKSVSNMFKATLVSILDQETGIVLTNIMKGLEELLKEGKHVKSIKNGDLIIVNYQGQEQEQRQIQRNDEGEKEKEKEKEEQREANDSDDQRN